MLNTGQIGRLLIGVGLGIVILGALIWMAPKLPFLNRLGRLPGDIRVQSKDGNFTLFVPIVSSILISIILTFVINIIVRLFRK